MQQFVDFCCYLLWFSCDMQLTKLVSQCRNYIDGVSRHFNQSQSNVSCQKRKKLSEDSLFASLESSSESTEPESKQLDLQNDQYETSDVTVDKESCISDTDLIDCGRESEEQQSTVSLSQSDDISEVYPTEPVKDAESRPVYVSAFRHHSQSSQKSRYWNQGAHVIVHRWL